jgi:FSR family fosmidomycin resistance protein-like MFS transporter
VRKRPGPLAIGKTVATTCVVALLVSIAVRSFGGLAVGAVHEGATGVLWGLAIAGCLGKAAGGFVSDRLGWIKTSLVALLLSAPLLSFLVDSGASVVGGMLLFQMTMPVTLMAVYRALPREPGLAFGLTTLALLIGGTVVFVLPSGAVSGGAVLFSLILVAAAALLVGLPPILRKPTATPTRSALHREE